ncbi:unnamed protein product [Rotaria sordida]|uniref:Uncharacterized protein n=1 Tax=Rotaria sordida TaxID=392033 RepID=A0A815S3I8_9BILA|nr:unnamed protein product [Rotaria sordida]
MIRYIFTFSAEFTAYRACRSNDNRNSVSKHQPNFDTHQYTQHDVDEDELQKQVIQKQQRVSSHNNAHRNNIRSSNMIDEVDDSYSKDEDDEGKRIAQ